MKKLPFLFLLSTLSVVANEGAAVVSDEDTAIFPGEQGHRLIAQVCYSPPPGITAFWTPEKSDAAGIESSIASYLESVSQGLDEPHDWALYRRQVAGVVIGDRKLLFVSYYDAGPPADRARSEKQRKEESEKRGKTYSPNWWKREPVVIMDGGAHVFRVLYDPFERKFVWYEQNGDA